MKTIIFSLVLLFSFFSSAQNISSPNLSVDEMYSYKVSAGRESYIKFVIFVDGEKLSVEYFDSTKIDLHVDFLKTVKGINLSANEIYKQARFNEGRKYFFGALVFSKGASFDQEVISFQVTAEDPLAVGDIIRVGKQLKSTLPSQELSYMPSGNQAKYVVSSEIQLQLTVAGLPIFQSQAYRTQTYYAATTVGRLKFVSAKDIEQGKYLVQGDEVLVLDYVPDSLPPVRGVITSAPTSANSHVSLLARMYSIPFLFLADAFTDEKLKSFEGSAVLFKATESMASDSMYLVEALEQPLYDLYQDLWLQRFPQVNVRVNEQNLMNLSEFPVLGQGSPFLNVDTCGAKASNGSVLSSVLGAKNSITGFCIPFYYFNKFLLENKVGELSLRAYILQEMAKINSLSKLEDVQSILLDVKQKIDIAKVNSSDVQKIKAMILQTYGANKSVNKVRFRSSSNAEDDERFNGAGLYESDGLKMKHILDNNDKKVEESLKIVWSSLYGMRAVLARKMFRIDESKVFMGILINQAFEEAANGVSLCQENYSKEVICKIEGYPGGELSVAIPVPGSTSEVVVVNPNENYPYGVMSRVEQFTSELGQYERVLSEKELGELYALQLKIYKYWNQKKQDGFTGTLDFEWKKMVDATSGETYMAVKQVREVPPKLAFTVAEPVIFFPAEVEYITGNVDGSATLTGLFSFRKLRFQIPKATTLKDTKALLETVQITTDDFQSTNSPLPIQKVLYSEGSWELNSYENREERKIEAVFLVDHPLVKGLQISLSYRQWQMNGVSLSDNIIDTSSAWVSLRFPKKLTSAKAEKNDFVEVDLSATSGIISIPQETTSYCINGTVVATTTMSEANSSIYKDGASQLESAQLTRQLFKKFKKDILITEKRAMVRSQDSHAFAAGQYIYVESIYLSPADSKKAGLSEEDHYVVFATGMNFEAEEPLQEKVLLFNKKLEILEKRNLSDCPGQNSDVPEEFSGAG